MAKRSPLSVGVDAEMGIYALFWLFSCMEVTAVMEETDSGSLEEMPARLTQGYEGQNQC